MLTALIPLLSFRALGNDTVFVSNVRFEVKDNRVAILYDLHYHKDKAAELKKMLASLNMQDKKFENNPGQRPSSPAVDQEHNEAEDASQQEFKISLALRRDSDELFRYVPRRVSGDIGTVRGAGKNKKILWDMGKEFQEGLNGSDFYFEVRSALIVQEDMTMWWVGGAAILGAGLTTLVLLSGNGNATIDPGGFPLPPGRPR